LVLLKGLLNLLQHSEVTNINTNALASRAKGAESIADINIDFTGVGLTGDNESRAESSLLSNELIKLLDLSVIALEDLKERSLSTGGTLDTTETQVITGALEVAQIHQQILNPQTSTLTDSDELSGLTVGETQARQVLVLLGELRKLVDDDSQLGDQNIETITKQDQIRIIGTVARGSTPVNDTSRGGGNLAEGVNVGHDIVTTALLLLGGDLELGVLDGGMSLHLLNSLIGDRKSQLYRSNDPVN